MREPIRHRELSKKVQKQVLPFFVAKATARTASDLVGKTVVLGHCITRKSERSFADHLEQEAESYFVGRRRESEVVALRKSLYKSN